MKLVFRVAFVVLVTARCSSVPATDSSATSATVGNASAQDCTLYLEQEIAYRGVDSLLATFQSGPTVKDEFETTAQFEAKQAEAFGSLSAPFFVPAIIDKEYINYDADTQTLSVAGEAMDNLTVPYGSYRSVLGLNARDGANVDVVLRHDLSVEGQYQASNSFGKAVTVKKVNRDIVAVFERGVSGVLPSFGRIHTTVSSGVTFPNMPADAARYGKEHVRGGFLISPKAPYFAQGINHFSPTITNPSEITSDIKVIIADISCAILTTGENNLVIAVMETL